MIIIYNDLIQKQLLPANRFIIINFQMKTPQNCHSLVGQLVLWVEGVSFEFKRFAFDRIRSRKLREDMRRLQKNNFESIKFTSSTSGDNFSTNSLTNYVSISDFKPMEQNYSSVKIIDYTTHGIKTDIKTSLAKRIQYTSNQLLNKETFLQNWMIRQKCAQLYPENYPFSDYASKKIGSYHQDALISIRRFTFSQYCKSNLRKRGGFFSFAEKDPLEYKNAMISSSLTYLPDLLSETALQAFEHLLKAGGQMQSNYNYLYQINQIIQIMHGAEDNIKQEIFLQIIKQISSKKEIYFRILCCACYCIKLSTRMYIPLLNYLYEDISLYENVAKQWVNYCFFHIIKNFDKERKYTPCLFQLYCAFHSSKIPIIIHFPKEKVFFIQSYTLVEEFIQELVQYYNLDEKVQYLLEVNGFLMEKGCLLDNLNHYCQLQDEDYKWKDYELFTGLYAVIVLKNINDINYSPRCHSIMYNYCSNQYIRGLYSLKSTDIVRIAALKMVSEMDDQQNYVFQYSNLITKRKLRNMHTQTEKQNYKKHILKHYYKIRHLNKIEARRQILEILSTSRGFNTHFFRSQIFIEDYDQFIAWVGVQKDKFIIVEPSTGRVMRNIPYTKIKQWGKSSSELCLKIDEVGDFHIECKQVDVITSVFESYINYHGQILSSI